VTTWYLKIRMKRIDIYRSQSYVTLITGRVAIPIEEILLSIDPSRNSIAGKDVS